MLHYFKKRKSPRASRHDYTSPGGYFITICCKNREHYFGEVVDGKMMLNDLGRYCDHMITHIESSRKNVEIHEYIVMPNHIHMILVLGEWDSKHNIGYTRRDALAGRPDELLYNRTGREPVPTESIVCHYGYQGPSVGQIINVFKGNVTKYGKQNHTPFSRQSHYHDNIIRDHKAYNNIKRYIKNNPKKWKEDRFHT